LKEIELSRGKVALVDDEDYESLSQRKFCATKGIFPRSPWYAVTWERKNGKQKIIYLHIILMNPPLNMHVDFVDGNGLNCQRSNMRIASASEDQFNRGIMSTNTSGFKGVSYNKINKKYRAALMKNGKLCRIGDYPTAILAAHKYDEEAKKFAGVFARLNFPEPLIQPEISCNQNLNGLEPVRSLALRSAALSFSSYISIRLNKLAKMIQKKFWISPSRVGRIRNLTQFWQRISEIETNPEYFSWGRFRTPSMLSRLTSKLFMQYRKAW
jgi:hypothetical protein